MSATTNGTHATNARAVAALAPGKALLCGEYAVLHGAPAISVAVDRYARATFGAGRESPFVTEALRRTGATGPVAVDTDAFYDAGRKLGIGSSAAVTVATCGLALARAGQAIDAQRVFALADEAHAAAQGARGSGVDVATSVWGGAIRFTRRAGVADVAPVALPDGVQVTFVFTGSSASTPDFLARVKALAERDRAAHDAAMSRLISDAHAFATAVDDNDARELIAAAARYGEAMRALGHAARLEIVTPDLARLDVLARRHGGAAKPSGAGGGDLGVAFTTNPDDTCALLDDLEAAKLSVLPLGVCAPGLRLETT
jgi:phosphomevalonate kinase